MSPEAIVAVTAVLAAVSAIVVSSLESARTRRRLAERVASVVSRLAPSETVEVVDLDHGLAQLDRVAAVAARRLAAGSTAERRVTRALQAVDDGVVLVDEEGETVFANRSASVYLGARHADAIVESAIEGLVGRALAGATGPETVELFGPPRRTLVLRARQLLDRQGQLGVLVTIEDVTERRRIDEVRRDFVANISHELKTPVGGLGVLAEAMEDEQDVDVLRRLAGRIHVEAMRASQTIDDLLELSRIEAGEAMTSDRVSVPLVLAEAIERAATTAEHRSIALHRDVPDEALSVVGDRRQLVSAVFNLVDNAVKYSADGSEVVVAARSDGDDVRIAVTDQGMGIPRRDLERIFERFYRVDRARSRETGGTGLGLAIVRHVAANHGGSVSVDSREGVGSTFTLTVPAAPGPTVVADTPGQER